ncbi:MAG TPA: glycosyltransferase family 2 protein [Dermatophilaceae bacterium]|nr:glycosyltransferase family 2 protein [Dermatophilaceae bacterium]
MTTLTTPGAAASTPGASGDPTPHPPTSVRARSAPRPLPVVTALVSVGAAGEPSVAAALASVAAQVRPPDRLVLVTGSSGLAAAEALLADESLVATVPDRRVLAVPVPDADLAVVLAAAVDRLDPLDPPADPEAEWLWLLPADARPAEDALARLVGAVRRSPSVGIVGPKVVAAEDGRRLLDVGHLLTRTGRRVVAPAPGEQDQGQYDPRTDVLAVGLPGMLVRRGLYAAAGGIEPAVPTSAAALDLGWRAQLAGERVVVVPSARIAREGRLDDARPRLATLRDERAAARRVALARCAPLAMPLLALRIALGSVLSALVLLLLKRPAHAWVELGDLSALAHPLATLRARWRFRGRRSVHRRDLATLFVTTAESARHTVDQVLDALTPDRDRTEVLDPAAVESGPVAEEAEDLSVLSASLPQRIATHPAVLAAALATAAALVGFRGPLRSGLLDAQGGGLVGGELGRVTTDAAGLWHTVRDGWHGAGLGTGVDVGPQVALLAAVSWLAERAPWIAEGRSPASVAIAWVVVAGMPLATVTAYLAGRVITRSRWPRAFAALAWGASGALVAAIDHGRVTAVLAHVLLPLVAAGIARAATSQGSFTGTAAAALGAAALGILEPILLVPIVVAAVALVLVGPGGARRARGLLLLAAPLALHGPALAARLAAPLELIATAGLLAPQRAEAIPVAQLALGHPDGAVGPRLWLTGAVLLAALPAVLRRPTSRGGAVATGSLALLAVLGLGWSLVAGRLVVGSIVAGDGSLQPATPWPGVGAQLSVLGLLGLALLGARGIERMVRRPTAWWPHRSMAVGAVVLVAATVCAGAGLAGWVGLGRELAVERGTVPAVALDQARGPEANRLLALTPTADLVKWELVGAEPGPPVRSLARTDTVTDPGVGEVVASLASGADASLNGNGTRLAELGIGFVTVRGVAGAPLLRTLDATPGLTRLGTTGDTTLWRVQSRPSALDPSVALPAARLRLVDQKGAAIATIPVLGAHAATSASIPAGSPGRHLVVAESSDWAGRATVRVDGVPLVQVAGAALPSYEVPAAGGRLVIDLPPTHPRWLMASIAAWIVMVFLAVPFGNRRSRRVR